MDGNSQGKQVVARGFAIVASAVVIGLILAASEGSITEPMSHALNDRAGAQLVAPPVASSEYFPSGYTLNASEPAPQIEQF